MTGEDDDATEAAFREVFNLPSGNGKRVLFYMLEQSAIYQDAYAGDNNATNYTLGLQSAGRRLIAKLDQIEPEFYPKLLLAIADMKAVERAAAAAKKQGRDEDDDEA